MNYCEYCETLEKDNMHRIYHDTVYGFPIANDFELFGRLILEINQAGLSWSTILKKQKNFNEAYSGFDVQSISSYTDKDVQRLLSNVGIIRNKRKISAIIYNAKQIIKIQESHGSFKSWLDFQHPLTKIQWVELFKSIFKFTGGEITNEFLLSTGYLKGAHKDSCAINKEIMQLKPQWMNH
tara:strand:- start:573 stop:1115 length:543 start_codon:yes stop_codon:yes gene_type:complete